jgi:hypothetical protein
VTSRAPLSGGIATLLGCGVLLVVLFAALAIASAKDPTNQSGPEIDELTYTTRLHRIAGPGATVCGYVRLNRDYSKAAACLESALAHRQPFIYAFKTPNFRWWVGLVMDQSHQTWMVEFDHENPKQGTIRVAPCTNPRPSRGQFRCAEQEL